jgi:FkbM family methyltransferase
MNAAALRRNVDLNHFDHVTVREVAVCDAVGKARFDLAGDNQSGALALGGQIVSTTTVDHEVAQHGRTPDVIKIDVEGAEDRVIAGMTTTLTQQRKPIVVCEIHTGRPSFDHPVARALSVIGYELSWLEGDDTVGTEFWAPHLVAVPGHAGGRP